MKPKLNGPCSAGDGYASHDVQDGICRQCGEFDAQEVIRRMWELKDQLEEAQGDARLLQAVQDLGAENDIYAEPDGKWSIREKTGDRAIFNNLGECASALLNIEARKETKMSEQTTEQPLHTETTSTCDGKLWAEDFNTVLVRLGHQPLDQQFLFSWFANAIMRGYDFGRQMSKYERDALQAEFAKDSARLDFLLLPHNPLTTIYDNTSNLVTTRAQIDKAMEGSK